MRDRPPLAPASPARRRRFPGARLLGLAAVLPALALTLGGAPAQAAEPTSPPRGGGEPRPPRLLFIAVDAVPFATMEAAAADPENPVLGSLKGPVRLISTFPSTTSLALAAILEPLGVPDSPGYEAKHFDRATNRISGGGVLDYEPFPWRAFFDWKIEGLMRKAISAIRPIKAAKKDIREALEAFMASDRPVFFIYFDTTDSAGHLRSPDGLLPILGELDHQLASLRQEHPGDPFWVVIFSDHGMAGGEPLTNTRKAVKRALRDDGFRLRSRIVRPTDVVFVPFGLVSSFVAYTAPGRELEAARAIAAAEGVDLCVTQDPEGFRVEAARGRALIKRIPTDPPRYRYEWSDQDPLELGDDLHHAFSDGGWVTDSRMFSTTLDHRYPDPFHRIESSFARVVNPASVVCSVAPGYMYGAKITALGSRLSVGRLRWTHGALERDSSLGFLMSDVPSWSPLGPVRFDDALDPFTDLWSVRGLPVAGR